MFVCMFVCLFVCFIYLGRPCESLSDVLVTHVSYMVSRLLSVESDPGSIGRKTTWDHAGPQQQT